MATLHITTKKPISDAYLTDSFQNFAASMGVGAGSNNLISASQYKLNPLTRNRLELEWMYRGSWLAASAIDMPAEDMCRSGITINDLDPEDHDNIQQEIVDLGLWATLMEVLKWARLYGGSLAYIMIDGQDPITPLNMNSVGRDQFRGLMSLDRWQVSPSVSDVVTDLGPDFGMPKYYDVIATKALSNTSVRVHHSRVLRFTGIDLPFQQRITEMGWGESVLERMNDRLVSFDSASLGAAQMCYKAHLRTLKIEGLRDIIAAGGDALDGLKQQVSMMRLMQSNEGITLLDTTDEFDAIAYNFSGLRDMLLGFAEQISGSLQIPMVRLFGQAPGGLSTDGDSGLTTYYDNLDKQREMKMRRPWSKLLELVSRSRLGKPLPEGTRFTFDSLWNLDETERAQVASTDTATIISAVVAQIIDVKIAAQELRELSHKNKLFSNIPDIMTASDTRADDIVDTKHKEQKPLTEDEPEQDQGLLVQSDNNKQVPGKVAMR